MVPFCCALPEKNLRVLQPDQVSCIFTSLVRLCLNKLFTTSFCLRNCVKKERALLSACVHGLTLFRVKGFYVFDFCYDFLTCNAKSSMKNVRFDF